MRVDSKTVAELISGHALHKRQQDFFEVAQKQMRNLWSRGVDDGSLTGRCTFPVNTTKKLTLGKESQTVARNGRTIRMWSGPRSRVCAGSRMGVVVTTYVGTVC